MEIEKNAIDRDLNSLLENTLHRDSPTEVLSSKYNNEADQGRDVEWRTEHVKFKSPCCVCKKLALRVQLLQSAHFVFHRLSGAGLAPFPLVCVTIQ